MPLTTLQAVVAGVLMSPRYSWNLKTDASSKRLNHQLEVSNNPTDIQRLFDQAVHPTVDSNERF